MRNEQVPATLLADDGQPIPFPLPADSAQVPETIRRGDTATSPRKRKVLIVDDEPTAADTLRMVLDHAGFDARAAYSGDSAVGLLCSFQPDVFITDVVMPGMTGIQAAIHANAILPSCKVLLISGNEATADLLQAVLRHGREFELLAKPFHPTDLIAWMHGALSD